MICMKVLIFRDQKLKYSLVQRAFSSLLGCQPAPESGHGDLLVMKARPGLGLFLASSLLELTCFSLSTFYLSLLLYVFLSLVLQSLCLSVGWSVCLSSAWLLALGVSLSFSLVRSPPPPSFQAGFFSLLLILSALQPRLSLSCLPIGPSVFYQTNQVPQANKVGQGEEMQRLFTQLNTHPYVVKQMQREQM